MAKRKPKDVPPTGEHLAEDPESQPHKGKKRGRQTALPGIATNVLAHPKLDEALEGVAELMEQINVAKKEIEQRRPVIQKMLHKTGVATYVAHGVKARIDEGVEKVRLTQISAPKEKKADAA